MDKHQKYEDHKNWLVAQFIACELGTLTDKQRRLFLDMVEEKKEHDLFKDAFKTYQSFMSFKEYKN